MSILEKATGTNGKTGTNGIASRLDDLENRIEVLETHKVGDIIVILKI